MVKPHMSNPRAKQFVRNGEKRVAREQKQARRRTRDRENQRVNDLACALQSKDVTDFLILLSGQDWRLGTRLSDGFAHDLATAIVASLDKLADA